MYSSPAAGSSELVLPFESDDKLNFDLIVLARNELIEV